MRFMRELSPETQRLRRRCSQESQHHRVRQRAHCILLSGEGKTTKERMPIFAVARLTISHWFKAWERRHFAGLYDHAGRGRPHKLTAAEQEQAHQYMAQPPQNLQKVAQLIAQETANRVSTQTLKRLLKKSAISGNGSSLPQRRVQPLSSTSVAKP